MEKPGFEGDRCLYIEDSKRGFTNIFAKEYAVINIDRLNVFEDGAVVTPEVLLEKGIVSKLYDGVKILGNGDLQKSLTVKVTNFQKQPLKRLRHMEEKLR